jgi:hypothetical protein
VTGRTGSAFLPGTLIPVRAIRRRSQSRIRESGGPLVRFHRAPGAGYLPGAANAAADEPEEDQDGR